MHDENLRLDLHLDPPLHDDLRARLIDVWTDVANAGGAVGFVPPVTRDEVKEVADRAFDGYASGGGHIVVATIDGDPVGLAFLEHRPGPLFRHWATVRRLQIHPSFQRRGLGARLLSAVEDTARRLGLEALHLTVRGGTGTDSFYTRRGYEHVATIPEMIRVAPGDDRDELYLIKQL